MSFSSDIQKFNKRTERRIISVIKGAAEEGFRQVVEQTPVDTGRLRGNWRIGVNRVQGTQRSTPDPRVRGTVTGSPATAGEIAYAKARLARVDLKTREVNITNFTPYAIYVADAPTAIRVVTERLKNFVLRKIAEAKRTVT